MPSKPRSLAGILHRRRAADAEYNRARCGDAERDVEDGVVFVRALFATDSRRIRIDGRIAEDEVVRVTLQDKDGTVLFEGAVRWARDPTINVRSSPSSAGAPRSRRTCTGWRLRLATTS